MSFKVIVTSEFSKAAKRLSKKYPSFKKDYSSFVESIEDDPFQGVELYPGIRKIRLQIKSKGKGKSGGARVITFNVLVDNENGQVYLLLLPQIRNPTKVSERCGPNRQECDFSSSD